jgi:hypothetical protein
MFQRRQLGLARKRQMKLGLQAHKHLHKKGIQHKNKIK